MSGSCPETPAIKRFLLGKLSSAEARRLRQHLLQCPACCQKAQRLTSSQELHQTLRQEGRQLKLDPAVQQALRQALQREAGPDTGTSHVMETHLPQQDAARNQALASEHPEELALLAPPQQPGEVGRLGHYRVLGVIGSGGMGVVFLAEDSHLERTVALKVMKPALARHPQAKERFLREARAMAAVEHECIVPIYQVGQQKGVPFIAMPLLRGQTLEERLRQGPLPPQEALRIARQVAAALAAAHQKGLIHRDIKPGNIWLEKNGRVRLLDFGLARTLGEDTELTQAGSVIGTPNYMAPEQAQGDKLDHRCDLFSLGAVLYHMLSGRRPFRGKTLATVLSAVMQQDPPPLDSVVQGLPRELALLVHRLLAKDPARRPQTAAEVYRQLTDLEKRVKSVQVQVQEPPPLEQKQQEHTWPTALVPWERGGSQVRPPWPPERPVARRAAAPSAEVSSGPWELPPWVLALGVGAVAVGVGLLLAVIFLRTDKGVIRLEINDPQVEVQIKGTQITLRGLQGAKELQVSPGEHALVIRRGDFQFETTQLVLRSGQKVTVRVEYLDGQLVVHQGTRELARARLPQAEPEKKPQPDQPDQGDTSPKPDSQPQPTPPEGEKPPGDAPSPPNALPAGTPPPVAVAPFGPKAARAYQEAWAQYLGVPVEREVDLGGGVKMTFVLIPPGEYEMGAVRRHVEGRGFGTEFPIHLHRVRITRPFYLGQTEVTVAQFDRFVQATGYRTQAEKQNKAAIFVGGQKGWEYRQGANWRNPHFPQTGTHPLTCVAKQDADALCEWLSGVLGSRVFLPSEAQWEYACRAGSTELAYATASGKLPWHRLANIRGKQDGYERTAPVGKFPPNPFGLYDMLGNVWECCRDGFDPQFYKKSPLRDPVCPSAPHRVRRGGAWDIASWQMHSSMRAHSLAQFVNIGLRVAAALDAPSFEPQPEQLPPPGCGAVKVECSVGDPRLEIVFQDKGIVLTNEHKLRQVKLAAGEVQVVLRRNKEQWSCKEFSLGAGQRVTLRVEKTPQGKLLVRLGEEVLLEQGVPQYVAMPVPGAKGTPPPVAVAPFGPKAARAYQQAWAQYLGVPRVRQIDLGGGVKMTFVLIPPGEYEMGAAKLHVERFPPLWAVFRNEYPMHRVRITRPFYLGQTEVTVSQFRRFVQLTQYKTVAEKQGKAYTWTNGKYGPKPGINWRNPGYAYGPDHPASCLRWEDGRAFCDWLAELLGSQAVLPSEAQWEYACRAGSTARVYATSSGMLPLHRLGNLSGKQDGFEASAPVGKFPPNPFGLYDMLGNLWECCRDGFAPHFYQRSPLRDPVCVGSSQIMRGICFQCSPSFFRSSIRLCDLGASLSANKGLRIVVPLDTPSYEPQPEQPPPPGCGAVKVECSVGDPRLEIIFQDKGIVLTDEHKLRQVKLAAGPVRVVLRRGKEQWPCKEFSLGAGQRLTLRVEVQEKLLLVKANQQELLRRLLPQRVPMPVPGAKKGTPPPVAVAPFSPKAARAYQEAWAQYLGVPRVHQIDLGGGVKMQLVLIPPGEYEMGINSLQKARLLAASAIPKGVARESRMVHVQVTRPFYIGRYEVTVAQFRQFAAQTGYRTVRQRNLPPKDRRHWQQPGFRQTPNHPVVWLASPDAEEFCYWLSGKLGYQVSLPPDEVWEFAARAGSTWANPAPLRSRANRKLMAKVANLGGPEDGYPDTAPVGRFPPNPFGLYDTLGNVTELCYPYRKQPSLLVADLSPPPFPSTEVSTFCRGSHFWHPPKTARWTHPIIVNFLLHAFVTGFRVIVPLDTPQYTAQPDQPPPEGCGTVQVAWEAGRPDLELQIEFQRIMLTPEHRLQQATLAAGSYQVRLRLGGKEVARGSLSLQADQHKTLHVRRQGNRYVIQ